MSFTKKSTVKRENRKSNEEDSMDSFEDIGDLDKELQLEKPKGEPIDEEMQDFVEVESPFQVIDEDFVIAEKEQMPQSKMKKRKQDIKGGSGMMQPKRRAEAIVAESPIIVFNDKDDGGINDVNKYAFTKKSTPTNLSDKSK